jgi:photosystem I subunit 3
VDGLPHLIADGRWSHAAEFILPGFGFIYITGWIGWVGRKYIRATTKKILLKVKSLLMFH